MIRRTFMATLTAAIVAGPRLGRAQTPPKRPVRALGLSLPIGLVQRADRVIE